MACLSKMDLKYLNSFQIAHPVRSRRTMQLTVAGDTPTSAAICLPVWRRRRNASTTGKHLAGAVWLGNERGLEERSRNPIHAFCAEPLDPLGDCLRCRVELTRGRGLAQTTLDHYGVPCPIHLSVSLEAHSYGRPSDPPCEYVELRNQKVDGRIGLGTTS